MPMATTECHGDTGYHGDSELQSAAERGDREYLVAFLQNEAYTGKEKIG